MGCDIHMILQIKKNGKFETLKDFIVGDYRSYNAFAVLANVRNGYGFAGCDTGDEWPYISEPRGLPDDFLINDDYRLLVNGEEIWLGEHSHSYLTLDEIDTFLESKIRNMQYKKRGVITRETYLKIKKGELLEPDDWSGDVYGSPVIKILPQDELNTPKYTHVKYEWVVSGYDFQQCLFSDVEKMKKVAQDNNLQWDEVRIVFGFDS
jgi:hypothetical protein